MCTFLYPKLGSCDFLLLSSGSGSSLILLLLLFLHLESDRVQER